MPTINFVDKINQYQKWKVCDVIDTLSECFIVYLFFQERLDFSCALFGPDGGLVANAPHIPVHLGAMQETVQYQVSKKSWKK